MGVEKGDMKPSSAGVNINFKLTLSQRIWLFFILPTALNCAVYIADVATDIAVVERHFAEARRLPAILTLILIYAPAAAFLAITLSDKRRQASESESRVKWIFKQVILALFFPIHAMHRFAGKLFWGLEALFGPQEQLEDALAEAMKPSNAELYLLLQPFLQAMPQVFLQTFICMSYKVPQERTGAVQLLSITTSLLSMATAAAVYMRFETHRAAGKNAPWNFQDRKSRPSLVQKASLMTTIDSHITSEAGEDIPEPDGSPKPPPLPKGIPQSAILSLPPLPPNIRARLLKASGDDLPEELRQQVQNEATEQPLNIRSSLYGDQASRLKGENGMESLDFSITLPPLSPAMRRPGSPDESDVSPDRSLPPSPLPPLPPSPPDGSPQHEAPLPPLPDSPPPSLEEDPEEESYEGSVHEAPTNEATGTTTPDTNLVEHPSREPLIDQSTTTLSMPEKEPEQGLTTNATPLLQQDIQMEGLTEGEFVGKAIAFLWWLFFIMSRILALTTLAFFYPTAFLIISALHYLGMTTYLFSCGDSEKLSTKLLRLSLGFVFLFCFIEVRDRFRDPKSFAVGFVVLCSLENVISSIVWYLVAAWTSWWFTYSFIIINISLMLSILAMTLYHVILKPVNHKKSSGYKP